MNWLKRIFRSRIKETYTHRCNRNWCGFGYESNVEELTRAVAVDHNNRYHKGAHAQWPSP